MKYIYGLLCLIISSNVYAIDSNSSLSVNVKLYQNKELINEVTATTLSGITAPVSISKITSYVEKYEKSIDGKEIITPGEIETGLFLELTPVLLSNNEVELKYNLIKSDLLSIESFNSKNYHIDLPNVESVKTGQTIKLELNKEVLLPFGRPIKSTKGLINNNKEYEIKLSIKPNL